MTFQVNAFGPSNVQGIYRIVEADDGKLWFYAVEYGGNDIWNFDPTTGAMTKIFSTGVGDYIVDVASNGAGTQWTTYVLSGNPAHDFYSFNDAGVHGANLGTNPDSLGRNGIIYTAGVLLGSSYWYGYFTGGTDASTGGVLWLNNPTNITFLDCIGPSGLVYGRNSSELKITKVDPATGTETIIYTSSTPLSTVASDGTNVWTFDGTNVLVISPTGTLLHSYTLSSPFIYTLMCYRPHDGLMYVTGPTSSGPNMPLYSIDSSGVIVAEMLSIYSVIAVTPDSFICYGDGKTMYIGTSYSSSFAQLLQLIESQNHIVMVI